MRPEELTHDHHVLGFYPEWIDSLTIKTGLDTLLKDPVEYLGSQSVALITNHTGVTRALESTLDTFHSNPEIELVAAFGPEHGVRGDTQDALNVASYLDRYTGLPVYSLYGDHRKPTQETLDGVDSMVFDIQDCGARFYTYVSTLTYCMEAAKENGVSMVILDRPNPINGEVVEGPILEPKFKSFIGLHPIPIRHGMTIGELAFFINQNIGCELSIIEMTGWERDMWFDETGLQWVQPSPNMPTLETAIVYPGTCLFEGVNTSEGRGTTRPFEYLGAPWIDNREWTSALNALALPGVCFRTCSFTPTFWRYRDERCNGIQVHVTDRETFNPVETGVHLISTLMKLHQNSFKFNEPTYDERRHFDLLAGTNQLRLSLLEGISVSEIIDSWAPELESYQDKINSYLLYGENSR